MWLSSCITLIFKEKIKGRLDISDDLLVGESDFLSLPSKNAMFNHSTDNFNGVTLKKRTAESPDLMEKEKAFGFSVHRTYYLIFSELRHPYQFEQLQIHLVQAFVLYQRRSHLLPQNLDSLNHQKFSMQSISWGHGYYLIR